MSWQFEPDNSESKLLLSSYFGIPTFSKYILVPWLKNPLLLWFQKFIITTFHKGAFYVILPEIELTPFQKYPSQ